jgi:fumarate reductase subunit C
MRCMVYLVSVQAGPSATLFCNCKTYFWYTFSVMHARTHARTHCQGTLVSSHFVHTQFVVVVVVVIIIIAQQP